MLHSPCDVPHTRRSDTHARDTHLIHSVRHLVLDAANLLYSQLDQGLFRPLSTGALAFASRIQSLRYKGLSKGGLSRFHNN